MDSWLIFRFTSAGWASSPIDHLSVINLVPHAVGSGQARCLANGAIDVDRLSTATTNQMMVIVADTVFVSRSRASRLNAPNQALFDKRAQDIVNGLFGDRSDLRSNQFRDLVCRTMGPASNSAKYRQPLRGYLQAIFPQQIG
jgi:hypothetical protein